MALFDSGDEGDPKEDGSSQSDSDVDTDDSEQDDESANFDPEAIFNPESKEDPDGNTADSATNPNSTTPEDPADDSEEVPPDEDEILDSLTSPDAESPPDDQPADVQDALRSAFASDGDGQNPPQTSDAPQEPPDPSNTDTSSSISSELEESIFEGEAPSPNATVQPDPEDDSPPESPETSTASASQAEEEETSTAPGAASQADDTTTAPAEQDTTQPASEPGHEEASDLVNQSDDAEDATSLIPQEPESDSDSATEQPEAADADTGEHPPESRRRERFSSKDESEESSGSSQSFFEKIGLGRFASKSASTSGHHGSVFERDENGELYVPEDILDEALDTAIEDGAILDQTVDNRTVDVNDELDEDEFFSTVEGHTTVVNRYDLEKAVPLEKKLHFEERERYWVNKPYSFITIFHSRKENETKYYVIEPYLTSIESDLREFLTEKLRTAIKYESEEALADETEERATVIERETHRLLNRYDLYSAPSDGLRASLFNPRSWFGNGEAAETESRGLRESLTAPARWIGFGDTEDGDDEQLTDESSDSDSLGDLSGLEVRPEPVIVAEDADTLTEYQVKKLLYMLTRDFVGYERIDAIKHDINVEDISCDGYNSPVFVYHTDYENIITNVYHGEDELDEFVVKLAQRSGKGISKRQPQVDATLPDGSRSQLTLGREVSDHGTNYTIRQFKDVPFTPIDLVNWRTFSLDQMAFLWLAIENHKSLIFAGGTASGKTTSLNAVSLFIPSNSKIVSIEDTREVELPQRNWIASVTRPSFSDDEQGDIDEFDLLEAALRQRPDYIVMGEVRGEEGRTLFQVMSTGHTTYTTFHADSVGEVLKRFTTEPINVSKTLFTALDLVSVQTQTRVQGNKVRKSKSITEINEYNAENDEINVQDVYQWRAESDTFEEVGRSNVLDQIMFDRGWSHDDLSAELFKRRVVLAYLIRNGLKDYAQVAATVQAFISDPETVLGLIANDALEERLEDLREMESVQINIEPEKEALVPRPDPGSEVYDLAGDILREAESRLFGKYEDTVPTTEHLEQALATTAEPEVDVPPVEGPE